MATLEACKEFYDRELAVYCGDPQGCSEAVIRQLEDALGYTLPATYRSFLEWMGADYTGVFQGSNCFATDVLDITDYVAELLAANKVEWTLPQALLAFFCHQGYICAWFDLESPSGDPRCWLFNEGTTEVPEDVGTFTDFLMMEFQDAAEGLRRLM